MLSTTNTIKMKNLTAVIITLLIFTISAQGQTDTEFWFAAPDVSSVHGNGAKNGTPIYLHVTAQYATTVTVSRPADPGFTPFSFDLNDLEHRSIRLDATVLPNGETLPIDEIENYPSADLVDGVQNKGFLITAHPGEVTVYYELDQYYNRDIFPLKGQNALGKEFIASTQNFYQSGNYSGTAWSGFVIVATENNTLVTIFPNDDFLHFDPAPATITLTLDKGETFAFRAPARAAARHPNGVKIEANKDIAVTVYDDSMYGITGCYDIFGDQIVPINLVGQEYIVMKGNLNPASGGRVFITPTVIPTDVYVDDVLFSTITKMDTAISFHVTNNTHYIYCSEPAYVNHITGFGCELGGALLPPIDNCTGSNDVTFTRTNNSNDAFYLNIMVRNDTTTGSPLKNAAVKNFVLTTNASTDTIPSIYFEYIKDSTFAVLRDAAAVDAYFTSNISPGDEALVQNHASRFHLGVINGGASTGCKYGYFSDYAASEASGGIGGATAPTAEVYCNLDPIHLVAKGGRSYSWVGTSHPGLTDLLSDTAVAAPYFYPDTTGDFVFEVTIKQECFTDTTVPMLTRVKIGPVSNFDLSESVGCSPFSPLITNRTDTNLAYSMNWIIRSTHDTTIVNDNTLTNPFNYTFPNNTSDTAQTYEIELLSKSSFGSCPHSRTKGVVVYPYVGADFDVSDTIGCHPLNIELTNNSTGHLDSNSYYWDFGDNTQSTLFELDKVYTNFTQVDTTYKLSLITESPFGCTDTLSQGITVHPRISVKYSADTTTSCSPLVATLNPTATIGADTLWWNIDYFHSDSVHKTLVNSPITITHYDTSTAAGPDTLYVQLIGSNQMGCMDTATTRRLIAYPNVDADFTIDQSIVCDSTPILFTNNSFGYKLDFDWDFGNNTFNQDTTGQDYTKVFFNRSDQDTVYTITLTASSAYFCQDVMDTNITVHPYVKADFGLNYENNCSPLLAEITNTSVRASINIWDFGTGTLDTNNTASINRYFENPYSNRDTTINVKLIVRNPELCYDSITRPLLLFPQVVADFDFATDSIGCAPLDVGFNNLSTGGNLTYTWDFGNNSSSTTNSLNFNNSFNNVTSADVIYDVTLTARNLLGCDSSVTRPVEVYAFVDAAFSLPVVDSCSPFTIRPSNLSSAGAHVFDWDFDNGGTSTEFEPIVPSYIEQDETVRDYDVRLIAAGAADPEHLACADTHIVSIKVYPELEADIIMSDTVNCNPLISTITNNTNMVPGSSFSWYIDDLFYSSEASPPELTQTNTTNYDTTHNVFLYGRSQYGCRDTASQAIEIYAGLDAFFSLAPSSICSGDSFLIDQSYTGGGIANREWDFFGEGTSNETANRFYHTFDNATSSSPITKEITLTLYNSHSCSDTWTDTIVVYPLVTADFDIDESAVCFPHKTVFTNNSINAHRANWSFGDGASSIEIDPNYYYNNFSPVNDNTYNVKLTAISDYKCTDTLTKQVTIYAKPDADFYFPIAVSCPPFDAEMINNSQGANLTYNWDFSGEETSTEINPTHTYTNSTSSIQEQPITLIVQSDKNCSDTLVKPVRVYPDVNVDFEFSSNQGCSPLEVAFTGDTSNVLQMIWYVNGKAFSTIKDPSYRFVNDTPGDEVFDIQFTAQSLYNCKADTTKQFTVFPAPIAEFIPRPLPAQYGIENDMTPITIDNQTLFQDAWVYEWDYGDGTINNETASIFDYNYGAMFWGVNSEDNKIPVQMTAWNANNPECRDSVVHDVIIYPPLPEVNIAEDVTGCQPFTVDFSAITKYNYDSIYHWDFGFDQAISSEETPSYTYNEPGTFMVTLTVDGEGGSTKDYKMITVNPKPIADFSFNDSVVFDSSQTKGYDWINFYNHTSYASTYAWYFDVESNFWGTPDSDKRDPSWHYDEVGEYYIGLVAHSGDGCSDTLVYPNPIQVITEGNIEYPTAFLVSPDGPADEYDTKGRNRYVFYPISGGIEEYHLEIYNRWGARIFESEEVVRGWNGYIEGEPAKQDVYIWRARGIYSNGQPFDISGDVTLIHGKDEI